MSDRGSPCDRRGSGTPPPPDAAALSQILLREKERTCAQIESLERDFDGIVAAAALGATDDEHDPEGSTIAFERSQVAAVLGQARERLTELDRALDHLRDGTFGWCDCCGRPIAPARLEARPSARTCIDCASAS